jgi:hypothetical protein
VVTNNAPWWSLEGVAEFVANEMRGPNGHAGADRMVLGWARSKRLAEWKDLADFHTVEPRWMSHVYTQGEGMMIYLTQRVGRTGRNTFFKVLAAGKSIDEASKAAAGVDFATLDKDWREWLGKRIAEQDAPKGTAATPEPAKAPAGTAK